jgi:uncharacterized metal-binding protein
MEKNENLNSPSCASCKLEMQKRSCMTDEGLSSKGCPTVLQKELQNEANNEYKNQGVKEFAKNASLQEAECYANRHERPYVMQPTKTRIVEICEFAEKMKYKRLGLAFCAGLANEASIVRDIFFSKGFKVVSVVCKAGRTSKKSIGIKDEETIFQGTDESMCNPIYQAMLLNSEESEFNILLGLCVGHDSLFFKYAKAPTTVLAVKDRVTGHNPLAAIYLSESYYKKIRTG